MNGTTQSRDPSSRLEIRQRQEYHGDDWWTWAVWVDGPPELLDQVSLVEYTLHPTFRDPVRRATDRAHKFELATAGWGTFTIYAKVVKKDGSVVPLEHELELHYPDGTRNLA